MTICKTILTFILLLTGYFVKKMRATTVESESKLTPSGFYVTRPSEEPPTTTGIYFPDSDSESYDSTGYFVKKMRATTVESESKLTPSGFYVTRPSEEPPTTTGIYFPDSDSESYDSTAAESNASLLVAGLSIFFVLFFICVIIGVWNARKLSKQDSFDITSAPSGEA